MISDIAALAPYWLQAHGPALIVVAPLVCAVVAAVIPSARANWAITVVATAFVLFTSIVLLDQTQTSGVISYHIGGFAPPLGIEYVVDALDAMVLILVGGLGLLAAIYAPTSVASEIPRLRQPLFYSAFLVCFTGLLGVTITGDAFNLFVFLEISSLSTYVLVALGAGMDRRALTSAYNYLILGTIGATFYVIGVGFLYAATGTLNMADMAEKLRPLGDSATVRTGFAFIVIGLGLKAAMFPLHTWLPSAYSFSPSVVAVFLASTATKVAFYALVRFLYTVMGVSADVVGATFLYVLAPLAVAGMLVGSFQAMLQNDARRLLALSSVAQVGYMLLGLSIGSAAGLAAGLLHLLNHALMKGALFMAIGAIALRLGIERVQDFRGLGRVMPVTMGAFTIAGLSLIGVPLTSGFISKWYLLDAALTQGWWWAAAAIAVSSILAFVYVGRILEAAYLRPAPMREGMPVRVAPPPLSMLAPMVFLAALNIWFGIAAEAPTNLACGAAEALTGETGACLGEEPLSKADGSGGGGRR